MNRTLGLWTKLLIAEYGRDKVIAALAEIENVEFDAIERELQTYKARKVTRRRQSPVTLSKLLKESNLDPKKLALVRQVGCAYEKKSYLPELWQVKRFLESHGIKANNIRSRAEGLPPVVKTISRFSVDELGELVAESNESVRGDLGIIADQILGSSGGKSRARAGR